VKVVWHKDDITELAQSTFFGKPVLIEHLHGNLQGNLHVPHDFKEQKGYYPAVLLLHGFGGNRHEHGGLFIKTAASLARAGMVVLRFDFRGAGETGGSTRDITIKTQIQDAHDAFEHLLGYEFVNKRAVSVVGLSFGGLTAALLAGEREDVAALVLWEAVHDMKAVLKRLYGHLSLRAVRARGYMQAGMMQLGCGFFDTLDQLDVDGTAAKYAGPVLIVQGVEDTVVPVDTAYQWKRAFASTEAEVDLIPNADHAFTHDVWAWNAIDRTVAWLQQVPAKRQ
jgi:pimeloyl-ACP methyl ester carboxylesterase